jgi:hypothetical protein
MIVFIKAKPQAGFWRCGMFHPHAGHEVDLTGFTPDQVALLRSDPWLEVSDVDPQEAPADPDAELVAATVAAIQGLPGDAFGKSGLPDLKALKAVVPGVTAAIRDRAWAQMTAPDGPRISLAVTVDDRVAAVLAGTPDAGEPDDGEPDAGEQGAGEPGDGSLDEAASDAPA